MRFLVAAVLVGVASAGCISIDLSGIACSVYNTQQLCSAGAALGCAWNGATSTCSKDTSICATKTDPNSCEAMAGQCAWDRPGQCDYVADIVPCAGAKSGYTTCILASVQVDFLTSTYLSLNLSAVDLSAHIQANVDRMLCGCLPLYFNCIYNSDCANDGQFLSGWDQACATTFNALKAQRPGLAGCSAGWCRTGRTTAVSTFTVNFTFSASNLPSTWSQTKKDAFVAALRAELAGVDSSWISFNAATGVATVTIPSGTRISPDQLNGIQASFVSWGNPSSSSAAPMFGAMGVESATVTAEPAPISTSAGTRAAGSSFFAIVAIVLALAKFV